MILAHVVNQIKYCNIYQKMLRYIFQECIVIREKVEITKNGFKSIVWKNNKYNTIKISPSKSLKTKCSIANNVTLRDIFKNVEKDKDLSNFISMYSWCSDIKQYYKNCKPCKKDKGLKYLEIYWAGEVENYDIQDELYIFPCLHGVGEKNNYIVSYSLLNTIGHLPLKLNTSIEITKSHYPKNPLKSDTLLKCNKQFTLLEVLDTIYSEFVSSRAREKLMKIINQPIDRSKLIPFDEIKIN